MAIYINNVQPKKIYVGTQEVKKVYVGTQLVWPTVLTGDVGLGYKEQGFAKINNDYKYHIRHTLTITERDVANNKMKIKVVTTLHSKTNYTISSTVTKNGSVTLDGMKKDFTFNPSIGSGGTVTLNTHTFTVSNASGKTIKLSSSVGVKVYIYNFGNVDTVNQSHSIKLPTM